MEIKIGTNYTNNTWKYMLRCVRIYGPQFTQKLNSVFKLAVGIDDDLLEKEEFKNKPLLFLLLDSSYQPIVFGQFMSYIKLQEFYVTDYVFDNIVNSRTHMVVLEVPPLFHESYDKFIKGKYSEMYTKDHLTYLYGKIDAKLSGHAPFVEAVNVMTKDKIAIPGFIKKLKEEFGNDIDVTFEDVEDGEYDLPPQRKFEVFNYQKESNLNEAQELINKINNGEGG